MSATAARAAAGAICHAARCPIPRPDGLRHRAVLDAMQIEMDLMAKGVKPADIPRALLALHRRRAA